MITKKTAGILFAYGYQLVDKEGTIYEIVSVDNEKFTVKSLSKNHYKVPISAYFKNSGKAYFILCRPLSDLTKEIEHNGERFVPIVELAKISCPNNSWKLNGIVAINEKGFHFFYNEGFIKVHGIREYFVSKQTYLYKKLYSWHFNIDFPEGTTKNLE